MTNLLFKFCTYNKLLNKQLKNDWLISEYESTNIQLRELTNR